MNPTRAARALRRMAELDEARAAAARELAAALEAEEVGEEPAPPPDPAARLYATAEHNPLGTARGFLNAHRRGAFPTFKRGRTIAARWSDVEAWMTDPARRAKVPANDLDAELAQAARAPRPRKRAVGAR